MVHCIMFAVNEKENWVCANPVGIVALPQQRVDDPIHFILIKRPKGN